MFCAVRAEGLETRYLRAGSGPTVVLLWPATDLTDPRVEMLVEWLSRHFRVIVPQPPPQSTGPEPEALLTGRWLSGVLDGLGISGSVLVVAGWPGWNGPDGAFEDRERIQEILILTDRAGTGTGEPPVLRLPFPVDQAGADVVSDGIARLTRA